MTLSAGVDSATASEAGSFAGINSPAARCKRRVQFSHSPSVHCGLRQSNSQRASSSGTQPTNCSRTQSQMFRRKFMEPPRLLSASPALLVTFPGPPCYSPVLMLKANAQSAFSLRMLATVPRATSWPTLARAHCILLQPPSRSSAATPSRMKVIRLPLGTANSAFSRGPENVQGSEKNQPLTAETRNGFGFFLPSQHPTTSIGCQGHFFT